MIAQPNSLGSQITLDQLNDNPYPIFQALLVHEPVAWVPSLEMWLVTRRADVIDIVKNPATYSNVSHHNLMEDTLGPMMLSADGENHRRLREPFALPFRPRPLREHYTEIIAKLTNRIIDEFIDEGEIDLDKAFSDKLALYTVTEVLGLPIEDEAEFRAWFDAFSEAIANFNSDAVVREAGRTAFQAYRAYVLDRINYLTKHPDHSVLSQLIHSTKQDLTPDEIVSGTAITIFGGLETTAALLSNTVWALLNHPEQMAIVRQEPGLIAGAIEETLRWESPVQTLTRHVTEDITLHGVTFRVNDTISCMIGAANRDPAFFKNPDVFDIQRENASKNLAFGIGVHFCIGAPLARMEGVIGLPILFERLPNLRLHPDHPTKPVGHEFRSTPTLVVKRS